MLLKTLDEVKAFAAEFDWSRTAFDTETPGLKWSELDIDGMSFANGDLSCYINLYRNKEKQAILDFMWDRFMSIGTMIGQNLPFDLKVLLKVYGREKLDALMYKLTLIDTYLADYLLDERNFHKLKGPLGILDRHLHRQAMEYKGAASGGHGTKKFAEYAEADAVNTLDAWNVMRPKLIAEGLESVFNLECKFIPCVVEMESLGVWIDQKRLAELETKLDLEKLRLLAEIEAACPDFCPQKTLFGTAELEKRLNSPKVVFEYVTQVLGCSVENADAEALSVHKDKSPFFELILEYRKVAKLLSTYVTPWWDLIDTDGRIRPSIKIVHSGRLSMANPNLENIPKLSSESENNIREAVAAPNGMAYLRIDYSQQELRIAASNSGDKTMLDAFRQNIDVHMLVANASRHLGIPLEHLKTDAPEFKAIKKKYDDVRTKFKAANFGLIYGRGAANLALDWGCPVEEAQGILDGIFTMFPHLKKHINAWHRHIQTYGLSYTMLGRKRRFKLPVGNHDLRAGFNHTVQGGAADMAKIAGGLVWRYLREHRASVRLALMIHDEYCFEGSLEEIMKHKARIEEILCNAFPLKCPVTVDSCVVPSYGSKGD